jgi:hypothetical protein
MEQASSNQPTEAERLAAALAEIERLRARILELEAAAAITHGTLSAQEASDDFSVIHDVAPNTPKE